MARKPRQPTPEPDPPTVEQAARIIESAWAEDEDWGTLVWLVMVTGVRRAGQHLPERADPAAAWAHLA